MDIIFNKARIYNRGTDILNGWLFIAVRPFNPEGVAPIQSVEFRAPQQLFVNGALGIVFSTEPDWIHCSNLESGDCAAFIQQHDFDAIASSPQQQKAAHCTTFLANAVAGFRFSLQPGESYSLHHSVALGTEARLKIVFPKPSWRVSYKSRLAKHEQQWHNERFTGLQITWPDERLQNIFDANVLTLLQLHDKDFISPGPYLYHHFWFRDAAPMLHALDRLGFHKRVHQSINGFWKYMDHEGFLKGPDGEWDSNGEVLWFLQQHFSLVSSPLWLRNIYPEIKRAAQWILSKKSQSTDTATTHRGLMPKSLSAEHFGMSINIIGIRSGRRQEFVPQHFLHRNPATKKMQHIFHTNTNYSSSILYDHWNKQQNGSDKKLFRLLLPVLSMKVQSVHYAAFIRHRSTTLPRNIFPILSRSFMHPSSMKKDFTILSFIQDTMLI